MALSPRPLYFLSLAAYLTVAGASISGVIQIDRILLRWQVIILLAVFIVLHSRLPVDGSTPAQSHTANLIIAGQTMIVIYLVITTGVGFSFLMLLFILTVTSALYNPLRLTLGWITLFTGFTALRLYQDTGWTSLISDVGLYIGGFLFFGFITNALSVARQTQAQNERLLIELQAKNAQLEEYAQQVETLAALEERNRLAREVHDTLGHRLTSSAVQLEAAQRLAPGNPEKAAELLGVVRQQVREALQELRQTVGRLRAPVDLELSLPQALRRLAGNFQAATGLSVSLEIPETNCEITPAQRLVLYRAAQEGLTNIQRHAQATQAWLRLACGSDELCLELQDNGIGLSPDVPRREGFGLLGLQERSNALGGQVHLATCPDGGAVLIIRLPKFDQMRGIHKENDVQNASLPTDQQGRA
jgi:signal transduction histidine kinase